jgi:hypothetical protein
MQKVARKLGARNSPSYKSWWNMRNRCNNPKNKDYARYGGRGIKVDPAWDDFHQFIEDVGEKPSPQHSIDRINNDGNYEPGNVRWATRQEQTHNSRVVKVDRVTVEKMRELYWVYKLTQAEIGHRYGLTQSSVSRILNMKTWR